jgi:uncharacterized membrane protein
MIIFIANVRSISLQNGLHVSNTHLNFKTFWHCHVQFVVYVVLSLLNNTTVTEHVKDTRSGANSISCYSYLGVTDGNSIVSCIR